VNDLVFANLNFTDLSSALLRPDLESCAVLLANSALRSQGSRLLVNRIHRPLKEAYAERGPLFSQLKPEFIAPLAKQAKNHKQVLVFVHTHPSSKSTPSFSSIDDSGERILIKFLEQRGVKGPHVALVLSQDACRARVLASDQPVRVFQVGKNLEVLFDPDTTNDKDKTFDRQVLAFGEHGQAILRKLRIGVVGLGGTGSVIAQQLAHLGVGRFLLIDPDVIEHSNLNRLVGASQSDIGTPKTDIAARLIRSIRTSAMIDTIQGSVLIASTARLLTNTDFFFCCTDSHGSRAVLNQLAYQYFLPCIDMGVSISSNQGRVTHITGRIQMLSPGLACLTCSGLLDGDAVRRDLMTPFERQTDPYFLGDPQPQPAVMSINSTMASLAVTMFLGAVTGIPTQSRYQIYNGITGNVRAIAGVADPVCVVCSKRGALGKGDEWPLPARRA
jgi:molybdopterin-synthase adenylyltransferase